MESVPADAQPLAPASVTVSRIAYFVVAGVILLGSAAAFWFDLALLDIGLAGIAALITIIGIVLPPLRYRHTRYWLDSRGLYIQRGIWWRKRTLVPRNRIQHTDVEQGPLQRRYHLGSLVVHTAGTNNASVALSGLLHSTAVELRTQLAQDTVTGDDAV